MAKPFKSKFKSLLNQNWNKLFLEVIVVFLGVTAGFLLNNWRTDQKESDVEQLYMQGFERNLQSNMVDLKDAIDADSLWMDRMLPLFLSIKGDSASIDSARVAMNMVISITEVELQRDAYTDIVNSGNMNLLSDFEFKEAIVKYYISVEGIVFLEGFFLNYYNDFIVPFLMTEYDMLSRDFRAESVIHSIEFSNVVTGYFSMIQQRQAAYADLYDESEELLKQINRQQNP